MQESYGILSLLPPLIAIVLAILTRQVFVSLLLGIWLGWLIMNDGQVWAASLDTIEGLVSVFADAGSTRTIMFCALVGSLIVLMQRSGGVEGFIGQVNRILERYERRRTGSSRVVVQLLAWLTGMLLFVESSISVLTVGALYRPVFERLRLSREKLAYIADSTSAPSSILLPFNGWGAFIMTLLLAQGFDDPFRVLMLSVGVNFYPMLALLLVLVLILTGRDLGPMRAAEQRVRTTGALLAPGAQPMVGEELTGQPPKAGIRPRARNLIWPIAVMVAMMPVMLAYTGWGDAAAARPDAGFWSTAFFAIGQGSGTKAVLIAVLTALLFTLVFYRLQGLFRLNELVDLSLKGISGMVPLALLMLMAFAIGNVCRSMGTGPYVAGMAGRWLSPGLVPVLCFLISSVIAFSTGTSWGTFAIMIPIAVPMAETMEAPIYATIAASIGGGVFGDHCSPISDTTILSSMASATDHIDHVKTQLPYALLAGGSAALMYLVFGILSTP